MRTLLALLVMLFSSVPLDAAEVVEKLPPDELLRIQPENPRHLHWKGRPTIHVASSEHYGSVINLDFDYVRYLATIQAAGLNHTRIFLGDYVEAAPSFGIVARSHSGGCRIPAGPRTCIH